MIDKLYQKTILKHAANATGHGALEEADHSAMVHNPMCGDRIKVYIKLENGELVDFSHEAKACALCQASASVLGEHFQGLTIDKINTLIESIKNSLGDPNGPEQNSWPDDKWAALDVFNVVRDHKSRKTCVTLPFDALKQALEEHS
ncbi:iron-sulfur cluster assembly scaffold protein [Pseudemcibacter aquimaris]|uniref:iron-sulfur cluster assembly scaffold protein n=1 Tax=Pseudemcibacter aquimaris TaxID=2857064 RepID=UPI002010EB80|nr:iron-sulfur cluster assembly scaffold protein [Pseudemcibacter aquimaris]MCC3860234.1 iron-sulfur cluster assembly scaffold protein [Pseudemcibacter aquimaris]WDU57559.1 iron-sulfur cluster assembly scaffold protein [Pseudemcibacter aquimaris]